MRRRFRLVALLLALTFAGLTDALVHAQTAPIDLSVPENFWPFSFHGQPSPIVFSRDSRWLFVAGGAHIDVLDPTDGTLKRRIVLPLAGAKNAAKPANARMGRSTVDKPRAWQLAMAENGKHLLASVETENEATTGSGQTTFLFDLDALDSGEELKYDTIRFPGSASPARHRLHIFVASIGKGRLVFVDRTGSPGGERLILYDLHKKKVDGAGTIKLDVSGISVSSLLWTQYDSAHLFLSGGVIGREADGGLDALRVQPEVSSPNRVMELRNLTCTYQRLRMTWDDDNYGQVDRSEGGTLRVCPIAVSPDLTQFLGVKTTAVSRQHWGDSVYFGEVFDGSRPIQVRKVGGEYGRAVGMQIGLWATDQNAFFVNEFNLSSQLRDTFVTVHGDSGRQVGSLATGKAVQSRVMAVSPDGRFVVTSAVLAIRSAASRRPPRRPRVQLWELD